jgi:hypothetical protein
MGRQPAPRVSDGLSAAVASQTDRGPQAGSPNLPWINQPYSGSCRNVLPPLPRSRAAARPDSALPRQTTSHDASHARPTAPTRARCSR